MRLPGARGVSAANRFVVLVTVGTRKQKSR